MERRHGRLFPDLMDWFGAGFPRFPVGRPTIDVHPIPIEVSDQDGQYVPRAGLPGTDPEKDIRISVEGDTPTIGAEHTESRREKEHSEFRYRSFRRSVRLPAEIPTEGVEAAYEDGILTVWVPLQPEPRQTVHGIPVARTADGGGKPSGRRWPICRGRAVATQGAAPTGTPHGLTQRPPRSVRQEPGRRRCSVARHTAGGGVRPAQERAGVKTSALFRGAGPELISQVPNPPLRAGTATAQGGGVTCSSPTRPDPSPYGPGSGTEAECDDRSSAARIRCSGLPTVYAAAGSPLPCSVCSWQCSAVLLSESKSGTPTA